MSLEPGTRIDRYRIEQRIGTGGMAEVYAITHARLGHRAALKVLTTCNRNVVRRMVDEGRAQAQLHHPNIVRVFDFIEHEGAPALVMELVEGPDLAEFLSETRPSLEQALLLFDGMLQGVAAAHAAGLVHRDLKPGNILLAPGRDGGWVPKVTDFGMVKPLHDPERPNLTRTGVTLGTLAYMAPEQFRGARRVDHRADIFGLGCILYCLVCGRPPFAGGDAYEIIRASQEEVYPPPRSLVPTLPEPVEQAIVGCLRSKPEQRIDSCETLAAMLAGEGAPAAGPRELVPQNIEPGAFSAAPPTLVAEEGSVDTGPLPVLAEPPALPARAPGADAPSALAEHSLTGSGGSLRHALLGALAMAVLVSGGIAAWVRSEPAAPVPTERAPSPASVRAAAPPPEPVAPASAREPDPATAPEAAPPPPVAAPAEPAKTADTTPSKAAAPAESPPPEAAPPEAPTPEAPTPEAPTPEAPSPASPPPATVHLVGSAGGLVRLRKNDEERGLGTVPSGTYEILASFGGASLVVAGTLTVAAGDTVQLRCNPIIKACSRAP